MLIGNRLKDARRAACMTQKQVAKELNIARNMVYMFEKELRTPSPKRLIQIANFFNISVSFFFKTDEELEKIRNEQKSIEKKKQKNKKRSKS